MPDRPAQDELPALLAAIRAHVDYQQRLGVVGYPPAPRAVPTPASARPAAMPASVERRTPAVVETADLFAEPAVARADSLDALRDAIGDCQRCKLAPHRTNLVFGVGNPRARLVFVGEGPGADEDAKGEPFVGIAAGLADAGVGTAGGAGG